MSEFLRIKQGKGQIKQQKNGEDQRNCRDEIHGLPQLLARLDVEKRQAEKDRREEQHRHILHRMSRNRGAEPLSQGVRVSTIRCGETLAPPYRTIAQE
jgi:hypothetical protein